MKRILTVSSGKGGVGKTTFAVNFALSLSTVAPTLLVDLDTGTSSVRNCIDAPVPRDLYHFFRKETPLKDCVSTLPATLDPEGRFRNFGFIAGPKHMIDDITNFHEGAKARLIQAINQLPAAFVVLDMKAGMDSNVIDFLPYSNSGILVFTPQLPSATLAASDVVKAILFRKLRILFGPDSPLYRQTGLSAGFPRMINELLDSVEDVYDESIPNIDAFLMDLADNLGENPIVEALRDAVEYFRVYYVLNMFNGVQESYETAIAPFVANLVDNVSAGLSVTNLGWVIKSDRIHEANCHRRPILLSPERQEPARPISRLERQLGELEREFLHLHVEKPSRAERPRIAYPIDSKNAVEQQLDSLRAMYANQRESGVRENFTYIAQRALHLIESVRYSEFGQTKIYRAQEILSYFFPGSVP
jgi:MinD-like ATPase involved in chromosome partitioning or flagellar assembly